MAEFEQNFEENDMTEIPENSHPEEDDSSQPENENMNENENENEDENENENDDEIENENENENEPEHEHVDQQEPNTGTVPEVVENKWPGWPGESVFRILVPTQKVGGIIGRKGEFIKKMCEEAKARIKILDGPPGIAERAVMVSAKEDPDSTLPPAVDGLLRVHKRIVDGLENSDGSRAPPVIGAKVSTRLLAPAAQAGSLIGKQGTTVKSIQEASSCIVRVLGTEDLPLFALQDDRIVEIVGEPLNVHKAVELIASHLRKFVVDRSIIPVFEMQMQMPNPQMEQQHMPPPGQSWGPPPQSFQNQSGYGPGNGGGPGYGGGNGGGPGYGGGNGGGPGYGGGNNPSHYNMAPPPRQQHENYYQPAEMAPPPMEKQQPPHHHAGISAYGREAAPPNVHAPPSNAQPAPSMITQVTQQMQIPLSYADAVIGTAGSSISYIRRASGATVAIQETRGVPGEMTVEISGTASQVQTAQQLIQNSMAEAAAAASNTQAQPQAPPADQGYNPYATQHAYAEPPSSAAQTASYAQTGAYGQAGGAYGSVYGSNYGY